MVSNFGRVMRVTAGQGAQPGVVKKQTLDRKGTGYYVVRVKESLKSRTVAVHTLVAEAFCLKPSGDPEVNHKDGNSQNNFWRNLEWVTHAENMRHASVTGLKGKLKPVDVVAIRARARAGELHYKLALEYGVCESTVNKLVKGTNWRHIPRENAC